MLREGDNYEYEGFTFELLYLDKVEEGPDEYAVICMDILNDYDDMEACLGFVDEEDTDDDVLKVIKDGLPDALELIGNGLHFKEGFEPGD